MSDPGLDLAPFLRLLRADVGAWLTLGMIALILALMAWTSWGSRRALRKCLVLSILAHLGLLVYGGGLSGGEDSNERADALGERIQQIRVVADEDKEGRASDPRDGNDGASGQGASSWDRPAELPMADSPLRVARLDPEPDAPVVREAIDPLAPPEADAPDLALTPMPPPESAPPPTADTPAPSQSPAPARLDEIPAEDAPPPAPSDPAPDIPRVRPRPSSNLPAAPILPARPALTIAPAPTLPDLVPSPLPPPRDEAPDLLADAVGPAPERLTALPPTPIPMASESLSALPETDLRAAARPGRPISPGRSMVALPPLTIARAVTPDRPPPAVLDRTPAEVPEVLRDRLDPARPFRALQAGASDESERAVERALVWLARHQDADGRWDAGRKKTTNGVPGVGETNHTTHCPPGNPCDGECFYYEADTATTGLALLAFLGAGYTHSQADGKYAPVLGRGLRFLLTSQKTDGDLRGESRAVGMYCHAMATLALCEAYALSGDARLREPSEAAVDFLVKARAADGMSWRYAPRSAEGDTSLLGWALLAARSAQTAGIDVPPTIRVGALSWLNLVAEGPDRGLAVYRPNEGPYGGAAGYVPGRNRTPTMTAEAWACRQFLGVGGPGPSSDEAARYLLDHPPSRREYNLYYWYYGTLAMFQHGGEPWTRWNLVVRDELVALQETGGHRDGSWDPSVSTSRYDSYGGRIYCTALAAMTLEVYYRYHRLDEPPDPASRVAPRPDPRVRRSGGEGSAPK